MNIAILAPHGKYFAAEHLARALNAQLYDIATKEIVADHLILIGMKCLEWYSKYKNKNFKTVAVIFSDTNLCVHYKWCNDYLKENSHIKVYAMPDLHDYLTVPYIPAYQTITLPHVEINKPDDKIIICHSPGHKAAYNYKGTKQIKKYMKLLCVKYPMVEYRMLKNLSWEDCIREKSKAHILIDQLTKGNPGIPQKRFGGEIKYNGGLGKSGIEGMMLGCCTMTTMNEHYTDEYFPFPPVCLTDFDNFYNDIERLITDRACRESIAGQQKEWADKYCSLEFVSMNVTRHINETI